MGYFHIYYMCACYIQGLRNTNPFMTNRAIASVEGVSLLTRSDKRKDRVEIAPEQLHLAALEAEVKLHIIYRYIYIYIYIAFNFYLYIYIFLHL